VKPGARWHGWLQLMEAARGTHPARSWRGGIPRRRTASSRRRWPGRSAAQWGLELWVKRLRENSLTPGNVIWGVPAPPCDLHPAGLGRRSLQSFFFYLLSFSLSFFFFFFFVLHLPHMEVCLDLSRSCNPHYSYVNVGSFNPLYWTRSGTWVSTVTGAAAVRFLTH